MALAGQLLAVTNRIAKSWWLFWPMFGRNNSYCRVLVAFLANSRPQQIVLPSLAGFSWPILAVTNVLSSLEGCFRPTLGCNKSNCRVLKGFSGPRLAVLPSLGGFFRPHLAVTNRAAESLWLFPAHVWPQKIVLPSLGGSFWTTFGCNKSYCRVLVDFFLLTVGRNKSHC